MITRLRFKNWRSLRDVTIDDLRPITVFIGANSSGKTNILDALHFFRDATTHSLAVARNKRSDPDDYRSLDANSPDMEIEFSFRPENTGKTVSYKYGETGRSHAGDFYEQLTDDTGELLKSESETIQVRNNDGTWTKEKRLGDLGLSAFGRLSTYPQIQQTFQFITQRWQMLDENFMPPMIADSRSFSDPYVIDQRAINLPMMLLEFMRPNHKEIYSQLREDFSWLLGHVDELGVTQTNYLIRIFIQEKAHPDKQAPAISAGTARILAMLTAYYALDMRSPELPGLVVIEEPDTALNPGLLRRFVEQLRNYTEREDYPRQFILTTHNPSFLNFFEPEEVRVVERDVQGYTTVNIIPDHIREIWLDKFGLGEVWTTRSLGGVPE
jgi:predicted ATPase